MTFLDQFNTAQNPDFRRRVEMALVKAAVSVMAESAATDGHAERAAFAGRVLAAPATTSGPAAAAVATNPVITSESSDGDLEFTVNSMFNALAGYSATA